MIINLRAFSFPTKIVGNCYDLFIVVKAKTLVKLFPLFRSKGTTDMRFRRFSNGRKKGFDCQIE